MDILKLSASKGTIKILKHLLDNEYSWSELFSECEQIISHRSYIQRIKDLEKCGLIEAKAIMRGGKASRVYVITKSGERLLGLVEEIEGIRSS